MKQNPTARAPGEAEGDGKALHGTPSEVSWDGGAGRQPYANQGAEEQGPAGAPETEAGNRGDASGRNREQLEQVRGLEQPAGRDAPRDERTPRERDADRG
ncbi:MAG TPA: hypothetical protein VLK85_14795 [Ramlibacter sp.]|nr:hypothetical protein [Ramlibacter sp.]